jgi:hypothetical protein
LFRGNSKMGQVDPSPLSRIFAKLQHQPTETDSCWIWIGARSDTGEALIWLNRTTKPVRSILLRLFCEQPAKGQHGPRCLNRECVNPWHLDPRYNPRAKLASQARKGTIPFKVSRNRCNKGHLKIGHNLLGSTDKNGHEFKRCRLCTYEYQQQYYGRSYAGAIAKLKREMGIEEAA